MDLQTLYKGIRLQPEMIDRVEAFLKNCDTRTLEPLIEAICDPRTSAESNQKLLEQYAASAPDNIPVLACHLLCAVRIYGEYQKMGIPDSVFYDTMGVFRRVCHENYGHCGLWQYDRGWWNYRHLSMQLFRIGTLEYEFRDWEEEPAFIVHIPTDAAFTKEALDHSFQAAESFLKQYYPACSHYPIICSSWLMAPRLRELLPASSGILRFQNYFRLMGETPESDACVRWLFYPHNQKDISSYAADTSLQRKVKEIMLAGGHLGAGWGRLQ